MIILLVLHDGQIQVVLDHHSLVALQSRGEIVHDDPAILS